MGVARTSNDAELAARRTAQSRPVKLLGRLGLGAYGVVHFLVAYLALRVALGASDSGSTSTDKSGALKTFADEPGGQVFLWIITVGLAALVLWQLAEAVWGSRAFGSRKRRTLRRLSNIGEALVFGYLGFTAGKLAVGGGSGGNGDQAQESFTAKVLALPYGPELVGAAGIAVLVVSGFLIHRGLGRRFLEDLDLSQAGPTQRRVAIRLGQVGYTALGVAYGTAGFLVIAAAVTSDPKKATGLDVALGTLAEQPYGMVLLGAVALGLACYGTYCLFDARYRAL